MSQLLKQLSPGLWHLGIFLALAWRLYHILSGPSFSIAACSLLWLVYRLHRVLRQPVEDLINVLGIEVPLPPLVSLLDISEDTVSIRWQACERYSNTRYSVRVNGILIGDVAPLETAISITGLAAGVYYTLRVTASTQGKFTAESDPIRVRTTPREPTDGDDEEQLSLEKTSAPAVVPYKGQHDGLTVPVASPQLVREHSGSLSQPRRRVSLRKTSPTPFIGQADRRVSDQRGGDENTEAIRTLTAELDNLRRETVEAQKQDEDEETQFQAQQQDLSERVDALKKEVKDKEDGSKELRKSVASLERQNQTVQQKRLAHEKSLEVKMTERRKIEEDVNRWNAESLELQQSMASMNAEKAQLAQDHDEELEHLRIERGPDLEALRKLEEQIHDAGKQVRELEETRKDSSDSSESPRVTEGEVSVDTTSNRQDRIVHMHEELQRKVTEVRQIRQWHSQLAARLSTAQAQQRSSQNTYDPNATEFTPSSQAVSNYYREPERRVSLGGYNPPFPPSTAAEARNPFPTSLHHNMDSGGLRPNDALEEGWLRAAPSQADIDRLTGGALASPSANALLPSDLLGDEFEDRSKRHTNRSSRQNSDSMGSRSPSTAPPPGFEYHQALRETSNPLPGLGALPGLGSSTAISQQGAQSPAAGDSRSPSLTSSPHDSAYPRPSDTVFDSDRRSIRSTSSSSRAFGTARSSRLIGDVFGRQRGKSYIEDGPLLGSLRSSESQSLPRHSDTDGTDSAANTNRRISSGLFSSILPSRRTPGLTRLGSSSDDIGGNHVSGNDELNRMRARGFPWSNVSLDAGSRPNSVYSAENTFPHPLDDVQPPFGWNGQLRRSDTSTSGRRRHNPWSMTTSRRGSSQIEPSLSKIDREDEEVLPLSNRNVSPAQAPIGTKPFLWKRKDDAKDDRQNRHLNPNARDFMGGVFSRDKKSDKRKDKSPSRPDTAGVPADDLGISGAPWARESSIHSARASTDDPRSASPRTSESGPPTTPDVTLNTRESLMKKLTRKSSQLPGLKGRKTAGPNTPQTNNEDVEEDAPFGLLARTSSSHASSPKVSQEREKERDKDTVSKRSSGFSLNSLMRRGKKDRDAPSISETSMTSGTGDEAADFNASERPSTDD